MRVDGLADPLTGPWRGKESASKAAARRRGRNGAGLLPRQLSPFPRGLELPSQMRSTLPSVLQPHPKLKLSSPLLKSQTLPPEYPPALISFPNKIANSKECKTGPIEEKVLGME